MKLKKSVYRIMLNSILFWSIPGGVFAAQCPVDLEYDKIYDSFWAEEVEAIQHQFEYQDTIGSPSMKVLQFVQDFEIPLKPVFPESKADPRSNVYGYNSDGSLDLTGGPEKSYNQPFDKFNLRYHAAFEGKYPGPDFFSVVTQPLAFLYPNVVENIYKHNVPYFAQRGFDIQGADTFAKFSDQYIWTFASGQSLSDYVALRLIWSNNVHKATDIPSFVDLHAGINDLPRSSFVLDTYKSNPNEYQNGHGYPLRIPVTLNFCKFQDLHNKSPIAFFDQKEKVLTIHVPQTDSTDYFFTQRVVNTGNPDLNINYIQYVAGFEGSYKVFGRNKCGELVPSNLSNAELFAQVSEVTSLRSRVDQPGEEPQFFEDAIKIRTEVATLLEVYNGVVVSKMNGGSKAYDCYAIPIPNENAYVAPLDPIDIPSQEVNDHSFAEGDNPVTTDVEHYSQITSTTFFDSAGFKDWGLQLPLPVLQGKTSFPENVSTTPIPSNVSIQETFITINAHEFTHQSGFASGVLRFLPTEGMAVGIELDTHASGKVFMPLRASAFTQRLLRTLRGSFTAMQPESFGLNTYGMGIWWKYLQDQFDYNNQVIRRTQDILSDETLGPLLTQNNFPDSSAAPCVNAVGGSAALDRALGDLFGKNLKDVWNDYSISITLLRNNTSIPPQWRHYFPYWIYNTQYSGYNKILQSTSVVGVQAFANWWEVMNNNGIIPEAYGTGFTGQTFIPTLPKFFEVRARSFRTFGFNAVHPSDGGPQAIKVTVPEGEWRVTLVQFTSDGTSEGSFIADGPHTLIAGGTDTITFDMANHNPPFSTTGNIRLVCVNVTFDGTGQNLSDYFTPEAPNGHIIIEAP